METNLKLKQRQPQKFGQYIYYPEDKLGEGYSSIVYKGKKLPENSNQDISSLMKQTETRVALKIMAFNYDNQFQRNIIQQQINILKKLKGNQHIINLIDVIVNKYQICLITEYCQGGTLKEKIQKEKMIKQDQAMGYFKQMVRGYQKIYDSKILHRDLKPDNILIKKDKAKIADFGFAITQEESKNQTFLVGSPIYMPLQTLKKNKYSHKGDIWAMGIILFEMLTGQYPFKAKTAKQLIKQINFIPIERLIPKRLNPEITNLLIKLLSVNMEDRLSFPQLKQLLFPEQKLESLIFQNERVQSPNKIKIKFPSDIMHSSENQKNKKQIDYKINTQAPKSSRFQSKVSQKVFKKVVKLETKSTLSQQVEQKQKNIESEYSGQKKVKEGSQILDMLLSQLHFCRLMYKVHNRVIIQEKKRDKKIITTQFRNKLFNFIFANLQNIYSLNCLSTDKANEFTQSKYYSKISKIVKQYIQRYTQQLKDYNIRKQESFDNLNLLLQMQDQIIILYNQVKDEKKFDHCSQIVILLDYLITIFQLLKLLGRGGIEQFHKYSKIQKIVQGQPIKEIKLQQFKAIKNKLKVLKFIQS